MFAPSRDFAGNASAVSSSSSASSQSFRREFSCHSMENAWLVFHAPGSGAQDLLHFLSLSCCRAGMAAQEPKANLKPHFPLMSSAGWPWSFHGNFAGMRQDDLYGEKCSFPSASVPFPAEQIWPGPGKGAHLDLVIPHVLAGFLPLSTCPEIRTMSRKRRNADSILPLSSTDLMISEQMTTGCIPANPNTSRAVLCL